MSLSRLRPLAVGAAFMALLTGCAQQAVTPPQADLSAAPEPAETPNPEPNLPQTAVSLAPQPEESPSPTSQETAPEPQVEPTAEASPSPEVEQSTALLREGDSGDKVRDLQARLQQLQWYLGRVDGAYGPVTAESVRGFQGKRGLPVTGYLDQTTLDHLLANTRQPTSEELAGTTVDTGQGMRLDPRCLTGRVLCASKSQRKLAWVIDGKIQLMLDARFGRPSLPTSNGEFSVGWKSRDHWSTIYDTPMPYALFFNGGQAVHYSPEFAAEGYSGGSHGCVNIRDKDRMRELFDVVQVGDRVVVYPD